MEITTKYFVVWRKKYWVIIVKGNCYPWFSHNFCLLNRIGGNLCHWDDVVPLLLCYWPINRISSQYCLISKKRYKRNKIGRDTWLLCIESFFPNQIHFFRGILGRCFYCNIRSCEIRFYEKSGEGFWFPCWKIPGTK